MQNVRICMSTCMHAWNLSTMQNSGEKRNLMEKKINYKIYENYKMREYGRSNNNINFRKKCFISRHKFLKLNI